MRTQVISTRLRAGRADVLLGTQAHNATICEGQGETGMTEKICEVCGGRGIMHNFHPHDTEAHVGGADASGSSNEQIAFQRLSDALTGGNASTWEQIFEAAEKAGADAAPTTPFAAIAEYAEAKAAFEARKLDEDFESPNRYARLLKAEGRLIELAMMIQATPPASSGVSSQEDEGTRTMSRAELIAELHRQTECALQSQAALQRERDRASGVSEAWLPISEAPKDGTSFVGGGMHRIYGWVWGRARWQDDPNNPQGGYFYSSEGLEPTHFHPLPSPPAVQERE